MNDFCTEQELMDWLKISRSTVVRMRKQGMPYTKLGKAVRYDRETIQAWLNERNSGNGDGGAGMGTMLDRFTQEEFQSALIWLKAMKLESTKENVYQYCVDCQNVAAYLGRGESPPLSDPERFPMLSIHYMK